MVKVCVHTKGSEFFPLRAVPILKRDAIGENHCLMCVTFFSILATPLTVDNMLKSCHWMFFLKYVFSFEIHHGYGDVNTIGPRPMHLQSFFLKSIKLYEELRVQGNIIIYILWQFSSVKRVLNHNLG